MKKILQMTIMVVICFAIFIPESFARGEQGANRKVKKPLRAEIYKRSRRSRTSEFVVAVGEQLPQFRAETFGGDHYDNDFLGGQVVLLQFAASWCPLSKEQLIETEKFWREHSAEDFMVLIFDQEDLASDTTLFLKRCEEDGLTLPMCYDEGEKIYELFATPHGSVTRSIVVDRDGRIAYLSDEYQRKEFEKIKEQILNLLKR